MTHRKLFVSFLVLIFLLTGCTSVTENHFVIKATDFSFSPTEVAVSAGQTFFLELQSEVGKHNLVIEKTAFKTKVLNQGETEVLEVNIDQPGTYNFFCSVGSHRQLGMEGKLIVQ